MSADYGIPLDARYRIELFADADDVDGDAVLALWNREGAVPVGEAPRRLSEVLLVGIDRDDGVVGVSSAYLLRNEQLGTELWYYRAFVAAAHRKSSLAVLLALIGRDHLSERFVSGEDTRAPGIIYEVENSGLKTHFNQALWQPTMFLFIGENERGDHVRVHYFPGALAPLPPETAASY